MDALEPKPRPGNHTDLAIRASGPQDEALQKWGRLAPDTVIPRPDPRLHSTDAATEQVWAMLVMAVEIVDGTDHDRAGKWRRALEIWVPEQPPADLCDGDLIVQLTHQREPTDPLRRDHAVDVEMLLCSVHVAFIAADAFAT